MLSLLNCYFEFVIKPIEKERDRLHRKINSKNIFDILFKTQNKKFLEEYNKMLLEKYRELGEMIDNELDFSLRERNRKGQYGNW